MAYEPQLPINLPLGDFMELEYHLMNTRPGVKPDAFVAELVHRWLSIETERLALQKNGPAIRGFQWKNIFLPDGTNLRTCYQHTIEFSKVAGDHIRADDGEQLTPSQFANRHAKGRNAWRFVWLRFPGEDNWVRADDYSNRLNEQLAPCLNQSKDLLKEQNHRGF